MEKTKRCIFIVVCFVMVQVSAPIFSEPLIINYDDNPNLKKAMEYDLSMDNTIFLKQDGTFDKAQYDSYLEKADRELAEKYYLAYLEDVNESFQRTRVYVKLANLYGGGISHHVTPHDEIDVEKALEYYEKAIAEAPDAVSFANIHIRGGLTMLPNLNEAFDALKDYYEWLLSINEQKIIDNWLPLRPGNLKPSELALKDIIETVYVHSDTIAHGMVERAVTLGRIAINHEGSHELEFDPRYLLEIIERFPGTDAQKLAEKEIAKLP